MDPLLFGVVAGVAVLCVVRLWAEPAAFRALGRALWPVRRLLLPVVDRFLQGIPGVYAKTTVKKDEFATRRNAALSLVRAEMQAAGYEPQPLASIARNWEGHLERASWARYYGPKPFGLTWLPEWTRKWQVHARAFGEDGDITLTAHAEDNPWRPDRALQHLAARNLDPEDGVDKLTTHLYQP